MTPAEAFEHLPAEAEARCVNCGASGWILHKHDISTCPYCGRAIRDIYFKKLQGVTPFVEVNC